MDGSNPRKSDSAATRKRRSSILKQQRAPRAPLSELEFNVATPQEQARSRRVSFSRRTGVAEFEINEATTAWKNVYEEHNKSLETSGNEAEPRRRRVAHLGGRIAANQFDDEEGEEATDAPDAQYELSAFTEHRTVQLFRLDADPNMRELTDRLVLDFSAVAPLADVEDELDVLQQDLDQQGRRAGMSEISVDVDFNATHVSIKTEESDMDMSITDTIRSPRVTATEKKTEDWTADKENIAINPYVAPPSAEFTTDEDILVFDGKKCKFQSKLDLSDDDEKILKEKGMLRDDAAGDVSIPKRTVLPASDIIGECNASVTGVIPGTSVKLEESNEEIKTKFFDDIADITVTQAVPAQILQEPERRRTIVYDGDDGQITMTEAVHAQILQKEPEGIKTVYGDDGNLSLTKAVPAQILQKESERRKTIVYGIDGDVSMTEAVPARILQHKGSERSKSVVYGKDESNLSVTEALPAQILQSKEPERRKTIVYENDNGHISMTETLPAQILQKESERSKTIVYGNDDGNLSVTEAVPAQILQKESERRNTIVYGNDDGNLSVTEAVPAQILQKELERRKTIVYGNDNGNLSVTEAVPAQILQKESERRKTIVYGNDNGNLSVTEAVPAQILQKESERRKTIVYGNDNGNLSVTEAVPAQILQKESERRKTIVYGNDNGNLSVTEAVPAQILQKESERRKTIVYGNDDGNLSVTEAVPAQILQKESERRKTIVYGIDGDVSMTEAVPAQILPPTEPERRRTIVYGHDDGHISMTESIPAQILQKESERRKTIVYGSEEGNLSVTEAVPAQILQQKESERRSTIVHEKDGGQVSMAEAIPEQIVPERRTVMYEKYDDHVSVTEIVPAQSLPQESILRRTIMYDKDENQVSMTEAIPSQIFLQEPGRRRTVMYEKYDDHVSVTEIVPTQSLAQASVRRRTIMYGNDDGQVSMTEAVPAQISQQESERRRAITYENDDGHVSVTEPQQNSEPRRTIVHNNDGADISVTPTVPINTNKDSKIHSKNNSIMSQSAPSQLVGSKISVSAIERQQKEHFDNSMDMSVTGVIIREESPHRMIIGERNDGRLSLIGDVSGVGNKTKSEQIDKRKSVVSDDVSITKELPANILTDEELAEPATVKQMKSVVFDGDVSLDGVLPADMVANDQNKVRIEATQPEDTLRKAIVYNNDQGDISMTEIVQTDAINAEGSEEKAEANHDESCRKSLAYQENKHLLTTPKNACDNEAQIKRRDVRSQIIVYEDDHLEVSRSIQHSPPAIDSGDVSIDSFTEAELSCKLSKSSGDKVLVWGAFGSGTPSSAPSEQSVSPKASNKGSNSLSEDTSSTTLQGSIDNEDNYLQRTSPEASLLSTWSAKNSQPPTIPAPSTVPESASVLDVLLDMSSDFRASPQRCYSVSNSPQSKESYITVLDDDPPTSEPVCVLPIEHKRQNDENQNEEKNGVLSKLKRRLTALKGVISYKKSPPKKQLKSNSPIHETEQRNQTVSGDKRNRAKSTGGSQASGGSARPRRSVPLALEHRPVESRPNRKSIVRSREDLLKDISMAQALMKAETEQANEEAELSREEEQETELPVVRKLEFEDEPSPRLLRKPGAEPETRPERTVIPAYLNHVSEHLKELVDDLMKPVTEVQYPDNWTNGRSTSGVQVNLLPSSDIDLIPAEPVLIKPRSPVCVARRSLSLPTRNAQTLADEILQDEKDTQDQKSEEERTPIRLPTADAVVVFDHENPLNNILLPAVDPDLAHKYSPGSAESLVESQDCSAQDLSMHELSTQDFSTQDCITQDCSTQDCSTQTRGRVSCEHVACGVALVETCRDRAIDVSPVQRRETEVNTAIAMRANEDLLAGNSSLTLVDDALTRSIFNVSMSSRTASPLKIDKLKESSSSVKLDSELTSEAEGKCQKRGRPKHCTFAEDVTPKPAVKVQRTSSSPKSAIKVENSTKALCRSLLRDKTHTDDQDQSSNLSSKARGRRLSRDKTHTDDEDQSSDLGSKERGTNLSRHKTHRDDQDQSSNLSSKARGRRLSRDKTHTTDQDQSSNSSSKARRSLSRDKTHTDDDDQSSDSSSKTCGRSVSRDKTHTDDQDQSSNSSSKARIRSLSRNKTHTDDEDQSSDSSSKACGRSLSRDKTHTDDDDQSSNSSSKARGRTLSKDKTHTDDQDQSSYPSSKAQRMSLSREKTHTDNQDQSSYPSSKVQRTSLSREKTHTDNQDQSSYPSSKAQRTSLSREKTHTDDQDQSSYPSSKAQPKSLSRDKTHSENQDQSSYPSSKAQRTSLSRDKTHTEDQDQSSYPSSKAREASLSRDKTHTETDDQSSTPSRRTGSDITVAQLLSEFRMLSEASSSLLAASSASSASCWQPEHEPSSKDLGGEWDPGVNVVAKIDMLPFMGTSECEWESRAADTWSFLLLRARLRLVVRLAHRAANAARACVRADTPVRQVLVQHAGPDSDCSDPIVSLCLRLATATLQQTAGAVREAGAVPALLRRAAHTARLARRWARAMRAAHSRLAFTLTRDGLLSLKVANIPMRSVWEVTLRVRLAGGAPLAADVRAARVVADWAPAPHALRRLLAPVPADWGHVPRTVWKIFKYLKNKRPEDDLFCV